MTQTASGFKYTTMLLWFLKFTISCRELNVYFSYVIDRMYLTIWQTAESLLKLKQVFRIDPSQLPGIQEP